MIHIFPSWNCLISFWNRDTTFWKICPVKLINAITFPILATDIKGQSQILYRIVHWDVLTSLFSFMQHQWARFLRVVLSVVRDHVIKNKWSHLHSKRKLRLNKHSLLWIGICVRCIQAKEITMNYGYVKHLLIFQA